MRSILKSGKMTKNLLSICILVCIVAIIVTLVTYKQLLDSRMVGICEEILIERLRSPSSYKRISALEKRQEIPAKLYIDYMEDHGQQFSSFEPKVIKTPKVFSVDIKYDVSNGFGAIIREESYCEYISRDGSFKPNKTTDIYLDGESSYSHALNQINILAKEPPEIRRPIGSRDY